MNVVALEGDRPLDYLLYSDDLPRRNDGRLGEGYLQKYQHTEAGGWWCSGVDLLTGGADLWGCFKPEQPRIGGAKGKPIKYEHPPKVSTGLFALRVPPHIWQLIATRYQVAFSEDAWDSSQPDGGFWQWLKEHTEIPLVITEGAKKAGALLSAGYAAIALPGIYGAVRTPKDATGQRLGRSRLIPQIKKLVEGQRKIFIAFDQDQKPRTIKAVNAAIRKTGYLLKKQGCDVAVITWDSQLGKGVDDLIAHHGQDKFNQLYQQAPSLELWKARDLNQLTYNRHHEQNQRYLGEIVAPETAKIVAIKSPKGTGKTRQLETVVARAIARQQKVLVIGHRIRLVEELCQRFGLDYIRDLPADKGRTTEPSLKTKGYGLCIDSLHEKSQAHFNPHQWSDALIVIDEVEQVLWHGLNSSTCRDYRVNILQTFKTLIQNVFEGEGQIYISDADLSNVSVDYLRSLGGQEVTPFVIENTWQADKKSGYTLNHYNEGTPKRLIKDLEEHIKAGGKPFVCLSAQKLKSQWGTSTLELYLQNQFPQLRILRIDSETLADAKHRAYGCMTNLNEVVTEYDVVLASPAVETGISLDLKGHFTSVWAIAQGIQTVNSVCQALSRVRENIPRYLWVAKYGFNKIGNGSTSIPSLLHSSQKLTQTNIRLLQQSDFAALEDLDTQFQAESLLCWAKFAVRINAGMVNYREAVLAHLTSEGHNLVPAIEAAAKSKKKTTKKKAKPEASQLTIALNSIRETSYLAECQAIAQASPLSKTRYLALKKKLVKTPKERYQLRKYELQKRYNIPVTTELVNRDSDGWYRKLRCHYFATLGRPYLADRDALIAKHLMQQGNGQIFQPDFNHSQLGAIIGTIEILGIHDLLHQPQKELHNLDPNMQHMAAIALENRQAIKTTVGIGLAKNSTPMMILKRFLELIGLDLAYLKMRSIQKKRTRIYQIMAPDDGRQTVFQHWLQVDQKCPGTSAFWQEDCQQYLQQLQKTRTEKTSNYKQLTFDLPTEEAS
ncbi:MULTISPECIES: plasmid replication protein, CyRepA1 family [[Limnothrix rosea] IAM M-220]|uniref:plasmid replication protein, CyRepA1 family n=1 Tax=[Limnothrix rosea] IAM M-220 TaxID=454133 RepID=UPI000960EE97|nr:bifunctional DNA primase/helicase [[Limnothrix rosea] IAM M-220]